jgi:hypothetical protein
MILETFFLVEEKRAIRTLFFQDLFCDQSLCAGFGGMEATGRRSVWKLLGSAGQEAIRSSQQ